MNNNEIIKEKTLLSRVPEITFLFWLIKILSTSVGETGADYFSETLGLGLTATSYIMGALLIAALAIQFKLKRYVPASYWAVVILMSIEGTLITDKLVDDWGISLVSTSIVFSIAMAAGFIFWYRSEKTLSIHSINTPKREAFYWIIILLAFALGTAGGDLVSEEFEIGYGPSLVIWGSIIAAVTLAFYKFKLYHVTAFWLAFIITRPLGASLGDLLTQAPGDGGMGLNATLVNVAFGAIILSLISYLSIVKYSLSMQTENDEVEVIEWIGK